MSIKECRICYEDETETPKLFIQPCRCKGTSAYVHEECLHKWRHTRPRHLSFIQCQECHTYYNIGYEHPIERYKLPDYLINDVHQIGIHGLFALGWLTIPLMIMGLDTNYTLVQKTFIGSDPEHFIHYLKKVEARGEGIIAYCYYYALFIFITSSLLQLSIGWNVHKRIVNRKRYWRKAAVPYFGVLIFNMHFLYLYAFTFDSHYAPWLLISACLSIFSFEIVGIYCYAHNYFINTLNRNNNECVLNYAQPFENRHQRYRQNVVLQVNNILDEGEEETFENTQESSRASRAESGSSSISFTSVSSVSTELL